MEKIKVLVLGATGMAGHTISLYFHEQGHDVTTFSSKPFSYCKSIIGDAMNKDFVTRIIITGDYDVIINCIGILNTDCEQKPAEAVYLNSYLPHLIVEVTKNMKTKLIQMSTDCVFSGKQGYYSEDSFKDGDTFYDRTKALGEINDKKNLTFRNSIIGPDMRQGGIGLFNWFMKQEGTVKGYEKAIWTGVTTLTLAKAMEKAVEEELTGIYNLVNNQIINKYDLLLLFNKYIKNNKNDIIPSDLVSMDKSLINNRKDFSFHVPDYETMIIEMGKWISTHKDLYPQYFKVGCDNIE